MQYASRANDLDEAVDELLIDQAAGGGAAVVTGRDTSESYDAVEPLRERLPRN